MADFVPNFVVMATGVGRGTICLVSLNSPTPKAEIADFLMKFADFYRAMHFSAKRCIAIACRLSVCLSVCDIGEL